jgi:hypothetical protein
VFSPEFVTGTRLTDDRLAIGLRLNWFRPLPLSCVEELSVWVDDVALPAGVLTLDGTSYEVGSLSERHSTWWGLLADAELSVEWTSREGPIDVRVVMRTRIPPIIDHTGSPVVVVDTAVVGVAA